MRTEPVEAMILAGGFGSRLRGILDDLPKPMARVAGKPFLEWLLRQARSQGVQSAVLCTGYLGQIVEAYFGDGSRWGVRLAYSRETSPLGTAGALRLGVDRTSAKNLVVLNGDSYCRYDLELFLHYHESREASATLWLVPVADRLRYGTVAINPDGSVSSFIEKSGRAGRGYVNSGVYLMERAILESVQPSAKVSLEKDVLPSLVGHGLYAVKGDGPFIDIGTPEAFARASSFMERERLDADLSAT